MWEEKKLVIFGKLFFLGVSFIYFNCSFLARFRLGWVGSNIEDGFLNLYSDNKVKFSRFGQIFCTYYSDYFVQCAYSCVFFLSL